MNRPNTHLIHRQTLRARFSTHAEAAGTQAQLAQLLQSPRYLDALDAVLSEFSAGDTWLELDKIEVDAGRLDPARWDVQFIERVQSDLRARLREAIAKAIAEEKSLLKTGRQIDFEVFIFFLQYGYFPAGPVAQNLPALEQKIVLLLLQRATEQRERLSGLLRRHESARLRLVRQFSPALLREVLKNQGPDDTAIFILDKLQNTPIKRNTNFWEKLSVFLLLKTLENDTVALNRLRFWSELQPGPDKAGAMAAQQISWSELINFEPAELPKTAEADKAEQPSAAVPSEAIFIENAGVVLLHPFLAACFDTLGWLQKGQFKNDNMQHRALLMLHYLATGAPKAAESELFLAKILCGAPLQWPLRRGLRLTKKEQREGESLLRAAIGHWPALKNTSPDGLREAFLQREGKLERTQQGWQLTVEQKAQDILLDQLPYGWGLGLIRLPWMKETIQINWA